MEEQYSQYVKDIGQLLEGADDKDANDMLALRRENHNKYSPSEIRENEDESQESSFPDQADREDDEEDEEDDEEKRQKSILEEEEKKNTYDHDVR